MSFRQFDDRLDEVTRGLHQMAHDTEELVRRAVALVGQPTVDPAPIRDADDEIDRAEVEVEESTVEILALHHPVARDLRVLVTVLKINNDLERIGDHAVNIAEAAARLARAEKKVPIPPELDDMSRMAREMLRDALDAFAHRNADDARSVIARDDRLDQLQDSLFRVMITHMPDYNLSACLQVILIGRNLERIGDLATNIGEDVVYMVQGITIRHQEGGPASSGPA